VHECKPLPRGRGVRGVGADHFGGAGGGAGAGRALITVPAPAYVIATLLNPRFLRQMATYDGRARSARRDAFEALFF